MSGAAAGGDRNRGLDMARGVTTLLVVLHHTAITYGAIGGWYYKEVPPGNDWPSRLLVFFCTVNQAWFMGFFFLLAGYHTPAALAAKGHWGFLRGRWTRLGWPLLAYGLLIGPATIALARTARGQPFADSLLALWRAGTLELGPLWFAWALLLMAGTTVLVARVWPAVVATHAPQRGLPTQRTLWLAALATGAAAFGLRQVWPVGETWAGLQWGYCAGYAVLYAAGLWLAPIQGLAPWPADRVRYWRRVARWTLPVLPLVALLGPRWLGLGGQPQGGWNLQALVYALWEPLLAWGVLLGLLAVAQQRWAHPGPLGTALSRRAFTIYVIHPPVVVAVTLALRGLQAPALLKFALAGGLACVACFGLAGGVLRLAGWASRQARGPTRAGF